MDKSFGMEGIMQHPQNASETSMNEDQIEGNFSDRPVFNSSICDLSDEEISTKKDKHMRLGPEDLNDTIPYNY